jgi:hypothetical protein
VSLIPTPEVRRMVDVAKLFVAGEVHFSALIGPAESCFWWARVHGAHPSIIELARRWMLLADQVWNEYGQHEIALPVEVFRQRLAEDLMAPVSKPDE